ncbi:TPA: minor capsid protein [Salmonella enterica subsp. enterica serovar Typhimurium]|nr:minor capsid protein [Salmonella enterica subsp. enterica serovar Typhimurium]HBL5549828.1 minor capsid protein [Salmonella enterica subsp. enterica serovar Typhimurium]HBL5554732.1 minor capsid protein [Salmonella enterica subsp. enterica serovar Typhimurium]HBL5877419.1 minor capsid protein [Salmonella enterica subsp. enterica serovar Typhimurium]HBL9433903.1 minor capsid protein [Salmonella enterica subsp. enterica serovar Typhimurium]
MSIIESFISHQVWLQRNASHEVNELAPFIQQMRDEVRKQVLQFGDDNRTRQNLEKLLRDLEDILDGITTDWQDKLTDDLRALAGYEANWTTKTLNANVDAEFVTPSLEQVWSAAKWNPLALNDKPADLFGMMAGWGDTEINRLVTGVKMGFVQGKTTRQIVKEVVGTGGLVDISQRNAATVVRTALNHVSTQAREATYKKNSDIVEKYEWVSTLDSRTSTICRSRDGQKYEIGKGPLPPAHPNCLLGDTVVSTGSRVSNVFKRSYKGVIVYITTKSGRSLSITPNHQVMTSTGWVEAGKLNLGSKLVCGNDVAVALHHQENNVVAEFADLFSAAKVSVDSSAVTTSPTTPEDFHGDGSDGEVEIVLVDRLSWNKVKASLGEQIINDKLPMTTGVNVTLPCLSAPQQFGMVGLSSPYSLMGGSTKRAPVFGSAVSHTSEHSLASVPDVNTARLQNPHNWVAGSADELANFDWANTTGVELDDVVDLVFGEVDFCGHVYNLENEQNWYLANGIIAHNCRSTTAPVINSEYDFLDAGAKRAARGAEGGTQIDASTTYYDFLKQQPAWFQDEALGPVRGKIFRNSGISPEEFRVISVDGFGRPLTLQQMAELDKRVADYLKEL